MRALCIAGCVALCVNAIAQNSIVGWEAYFDVDNGPGNGQWFPVSNNDTVSVVDAVDASSIGSGFHKLFVRFKTSGGLWSTPNACAVYVRPDVAPPLVHEVIACEYYVGDVDPGCGVGTPIPLDSVASTIYLQRELDLLSVGLANGNYFVNIRYKSSSGSWSMIERRPFTVCDTYGAIAGFETYRSGSSVSVVDQSQYATSIIYDFGDGQTDTTWNPMHHYDVLGNYTVTQTATNACAISTTLQFVRISGLNDYAPHVGGNGGFCSIQLNGMNFVPDMTVTLQQGGSPVVSADTVYQFSPNSASAVLNLLGQDAGTYDLVIDLPGDTTMFIPNGFEIQDVGESVAVGVQWIVPSIMRSNRPRTVILRLSNSNINDVLAAPVWIGYSNDLSFEFIDSIIDPVFSGSDTLPSDVSVNYLLGEPFVGRLTALLIGRVPANGFVDIPIRISSSLQSGTAKLRAWMGNPLLTMDGVFQFTPEGKTRSEAASSWSCIACYLGIVPGLGCTLGIGETLLTPFIADVVNDPEAKSNYFKLMLMTSAGCGETAVDILTFGATAGPNAIGGFMLCTMAYNCFQPNPVPTNVGVSSSYDPNEKNGPSGLAESGFTPGLASLSYKIAFENLDTAALPAQRVVIVDTLDNSVFDVRSASLGWVGLADSIITCTPLARNWTVEHPLNAGYALRLNAAIDTVNAIVTWDFFMIDTLTNALPVDPLTGFLPPNVTSPEGEGFVTLDLPLRTGLPHGQVIQNRASIFFDDNAPIVTNAWLNTLDLLPPTSLTEPLPTFSSDTLVEVFWSGTDPGSGIAKYYVYSSVDTTIGYDLWLVTGATSGTFDGEDGVTYHFYVVAEDSVGNREEKSPTSEAQSTIDFSTGVEPILAQGAFDLFPNPTTGGITLVGSTEEPCILQVEVRNTVGQLLEQRSIPTGTGPIRVSLDLPRLAVGTYMASITCADVKLVERLIKISE
jgi:PKD repeat protein